MDLARYINNARRAYRRRNMTYLIIDALLFVAGVSLLMRLLPAIARLVIVACAAVTLAVGVATKAARLARFFRRETGAG